MMLLPLSIRYNRVMLAGVREFMVGIIDYAGLFPPAKLQMEPAVRNYAQIGRAHV